MVLERDDKVLVRAPDSVLTIVTANVLSPSGLVVVHVVDSVVFAGLAQPPTPPAPPGQAAPAPPPPPALTVSEVRSAQLPPHAQDDSLCTRTHGPAPRPATAEQSRPHRAHLVIVQVLVALPELTIFRALVNRTSLPPVFQNISAVTNWTAAFSDRTRKWTVFAATDDAFRCGHEFSCGAFLQLVCCCRVLTCGLTRCARACRAFQADLTAQFLSGGGLLGVPEVRSTPHLSHTGALRLLCWAYTDKRARSHVALRRSTPSSWTLPWWRGRSAD